MSQLLTDMTNSAVFTVLQNAGNANGNGVVLDLSTYKGPVTFVCAVGQSTHGVGTLNVAVLQQSNDNGSSDAFANVTGGAFTAVVNTANASNVGIQKKTFDVRELERYVRVPIEVSGTNANIPISIHAIGQLERKAD